MLLARLGAHLVDLVHPPACLVCGTGIDRGPALCPGCWAGMPFIERPYCERLGLPFAADPGGPLLSPAAMADPPAYGRARAAARYEGVARDLVHRLKYADALDLAEVLGAWTHRAGAELLREAAVVVPVPLHRLRLWRRRFNQAAALAQVVARRAGLPFAPRAIERVRRTRPQVGLTRAERGENLRGAFRVPFAAVPLIAGRRVLLVDDVVTTGATANACARALLKAGAGGVDVLAFARVAEPGRDAI